MATSRTITLRIFIITPDSRGKRRPACARSPTRFTPTRPAASAAMTTVAKYQPGMCSARWVFIGLDGGSTSTKAVLLSEPGEVLSKAYQLSKGNPIQDTIDLFENLRQQVETQGASLEVLGVGTTGYAKDILQKVLHADVALVETVAHA